MAKSNKLKLIEYSKSASDFLDSIQVDIHNRVVLKKDRARSAIFMWWDDKDRCYMNTADGTLDGLMDPSTFVMSQDILQHLTWYISNKYKLYTISNE